MPASLLGSERSASIQYLKEKLRRTNLIISLVLRSELKIIIKETLFLLLYVSLLYIIIP